jgi:hypothetical protein
MALSTIFQLNRGSQFYCCSKPEYADIFLPDIHIKRKLSAKPDLAQAVKPV